MSEKIRVTIDLSTQITEMAQEEIVKQVAFLAAGIEEVRFRDPSTLEFHAGANDGVESVSEQARALVQRVQKTLRGLKRKVVYRSAAMDDPHFAPARPVAGIDFEGTGLAVLQGLPLALFEYFDRRFSEFGQAWSPRAMRVPTLIPTPVLARCSYFKSFPQTVTFAAHLPEDPRQIQAFQERHRTRETLDEQVPASLVVPEACLSPAMCYHVYHAHRDTALPDSGLVASLAGKCFRYEASNMHDLNRLWDFTMRELVFMGKREALLAERKRGMELFGEFLEEHRLAAEIRTASDPFFIAPDSAAKTFFQIGWETKFEISLPLPDGSRLAVGSFNDHSDFFGKAFNITLAGGAPVDSVCFAWGLERWVHAFLAQHGDEPSRWPDVMQRAPELASV
jgi:hypothetical protein